MNNQIITGYASETLLRAAAEWVAELPAGSEALILAASRSAADDFVRAYTLGNPNGGQGALPQQERARMPALPGCGTPGGLPEERGQAGDVSSPRRQPFLHRYTLQMLAAEMASTRLAAKELSIASGLGSLAVAARSAFACREKLRYFKEVAPMPGFPRGLARTAQELRMERVPPSKLRARGTGLAGADMAMLLAEFERQLTACSLADSATIFEFAREAAEKGEHRLVGLPILLLDVTPRTAAEADLLGALIVKATACLAVVLEGDTTTRELLGGAARRLMPRFARQQGGEDAPGADGLGEAALRGIKGRTGSDAGETPALPVSDMEGSADGMGVAGETPPNSGQSALPVRDTRGEDNSLGRAQRYVFRADAIEQRPPDESVVLFSAASEGKECVEIARRALAAAGDGVPFDRMAVALRHPLIYQPLIEDAFRRAGVPAWFTHGTERPDPAGRAFLALLACAAEDCSAARFAEYLSFAQVPPVEQESGTGIPASASGTGIPACASPEPARPLENAQARMPVPPDGPPAVSPAQAAMPVPPVGTPHEARQAGLPLTNGLTVARPPQATSHKPQAERQPWPYAKPQGELFALRPDPREAMEAGEANAAEDGAGAPSDAALRAAGTKAGETPALPVRDTRGSTGGTPALPARDTEGAADGTGVAGETPALPVSDTHGSADGMGVAGETPALPVSDTLAAGDTQGPVDAAPPGSAGILPALSAAESAGEDKEQEASEDAMVVAGTLRVPRDWEKLIVEASVVGGHDRWKRRLDGLAEEMRGRLKEMHAEDDARARRLKREIALLENLRRFALPLIDSLSRLPKSASWAEWLRALNELAAASLRRPQTVLAVLAELQPLETVGPAGLTEVIDVLTERLTELRVEPPARRYGRLLVATPAELRGRAFDIVFVPGLAEGAFPRRIFEDPLLLDHVRTQLGLRLKDQTVAEERLVLQAALAAASRQVVVSYPRTDSAQGRARVPSFYALEIIRAAEGALPVLPQLEDRARIAADAEPGWGAPADASAAIDVTEYDIAVIRNLSQAGDAGRQGRAAYLLDTNAHLARSLRARARRWRGKWTPDDGLVSPGEEALGILATQRLNKRAYSPSALQLYASCPYRFALSGIFYLRPREEAVAVERLDPLTRGSLFHEAQYAILSSLKRKKLLPVTAKNRERAIEAADRELDAVAADFKERLAPAIVSVWEGEIEEIRADLRGWLRDVAVQDSGWVPEHFELAFGLDRDYVHDTAQHHDVVEVLGVVRLRGSIDLVEQRGGAGETRLRVVDHKTGRVPDPLPLRLGFGKTLQPILYAAAAEKLLNATADAGDLYYCTLRGSYTRVSVPINPSSRMAAAHALGIIDEAVERGFLPAAPEPRACDWCDYLPVCGPYEVERASRKQKDPLARLTSLREMP